MANEDSIFVVDDDNSARKGIARLLRTAGYSVRNFASSDEFLEALDSEMPDCVVMDAGSPGVSSEKLGAELQARNVSAPIIIVTAHDDPQSRQRADELHAIGFFRKPIDGTALLDAINWALTTHRRDTFSEDTNGKTAIRS